LPVPGRQRSVERERYSPDGRIEIQVHAADRLRYSILLSGKTLLQGQPYLDEDRSADARLQPQSPGHQGRTVDQSSSPRCGRSSLPFANTTTSCGWSWQGTTPWSFGHSTRAWPIELRLSFRNPQVKVYSEEVNFNFAGDYSVYYPREDSFMSHNEREFLYLTLKENRSRRHREFAGSRRHKSWSQACHCRSGRR